MIPRLTILPFTRFLLIILIGFTTLHHVNLRRTNDAGTSIPDSLIALRPALILRRPWTLLTASWAESGAITFLLSGGAIYHAGRYLERAWGAMAFVNFVAVATVIPMGVVMILVILGGFLHIGSTTTIISGTLPLLISFVVAFKQLVPEHSITLFHPALSIRVKHLPLLFLASTILPSLLAGTALPTILATIALFTTWTRLRFFAAPPHHTTTSTAPPARGDASDTFAFASFFPAATQPAISTITDAIFAILVALHLCSPFSDDAVEHGNLDAAQRTEGGILGGGKGGRGKREEAERRRALALKALDQRLMAAGAGAGSVAKATSVPLQPERREQDDARGRGDVVVQADREGHERLEGKTESV